MRKGTNGAVGGGPWYCPCQPLGEQLKRSNRHPAHSLFHNLISPPVKGGIGGWEIERRRRRHSLWPSGAAILCPPLTMAALFSFFPASKVGSEEKAVRSIVTPLEKRKSNLPRAGTI